MESVTENGAKENVEHPWQTIGQLEAEVYKTWNRKFHKLVYQSLTQLFVDFFDSTAL